MSILTNLAEKVLARASTAEQKGLALVHTKIEGDVISWTVKNLTGGNVHEVINEALKYYAEAVTKAAKETKMAKAEVGKAVKAGLRETKVAVKLEDKPATKAKK